MKRDLPTRRRLLRIASVVGLGGLAGCVADSLEPPGAGATTLDHAEGAAEGESALTVRIVGTNAPVHAGAYLGVTADVHNPGAVAVTEELGLVVGHDPTVEDVETVTVPAGETATVTLGYVTPHVDNDQEFPVQVQGVGDADEQTVRVNGDGGDDLVVEFVSCTRVEVTGAFEAGEAVAASTAFYDVDGLFGNTLIEDAVTVGREVQAPYSGTIVFEVGEEVRVDETTDGVYVEVPDRGGLGTAITGITSPEGYDDASITHLNPREVECLEEIRSRVESVDGAASTVDVSIVETNAPVRAGEFLEVVVTVENVGEEATTRDLELVVGHDPTVEDVESVGLAPGDAVQFGMGYETPLVENDQEFPVRVVTGDDADERTVVVFGTG